MHVTFVFKLTGHVCASGSLQRTNLDNVKNTKTEVFNI